MRKRIVIKSVIAVVAAGFMLSLSSCKKDEKRIIGVWKIEKIEITDLACSDPFMTFALKSAIQQYMALGAGVLSSGEIEFTKSGKMITSTPFGSSAEDYVVSNGKLTIISNGTTNVSDISFPDRKTMWMDAHASEQDISDLSEVLRMVMDEDVQITKISSRTILKKQQ
jgi:hypothetical protein